MKSVNFYICHNHDMAREEIQTWKENGQAFIQERKNELPDTVRVNVNQDMCPKCLGNSMSYIESKKIKPKCIKPNYKTPWMRRLN